MEAAALGVLRSDDPRSQQLTPHLESHTCDGPQPIADAMSPFVDIDSDDAEVSSSGRGTGRRIGGQRVGWSRIDDEKCRRVGNRFVPRGDVIEGKGQIVGFGKAQLYAGYASIRRCVSHVSASASQYLAYPWVAPCERAKCSISPATGGATAKRAVVGSDGCWTVPCIAHAAKTPIPQAKSTRGALLPLRPSNGSSAATAT